MMNTSVHSGHPGISPTLLLFCYSFWWPSIFKDVATVKSCHVCAWSKTPKEKTSGLLQPLPISCRPWAHLSIHFVTNLLLSFGFTRILIITECCSETCHLVPPKGLPQRWKLLKPSSIMCLGTMVCQRTLSWIGERNLLNKFRELSASNWILM